MWHNSSSAVQNRRRFCATAPAVKDWARTECKSYLCKRRVVRVRGYAPSVRAYFFMLFPPRVRRHGSARSVLRPSQLPSELTRLIPQLNIVLARIHPLSSNPTSGLSPRTARPDDMRPPVDQQCFFVGLHGVDGAFICAYRGLGA